MSERHKLQAIQSQVHCGRLLEVGPSRGSFALLAQKAGFDVTVIERDTECCRFLENVLGLRAVNSANPEEAVKLGEKFDVIALWQVIEHLTEPWLFLAAAAERVAPNGILVLSTPNPDSFQFRLFRGYWTHVDAPRHVQLIPASLLMTLGQDLGLSLEFLSASDKGVEVHNLFGWEKTIDNMFDRPRLKEIGRRNAAKVSRWLAPIEHRNLYGSCYTLIMRQTD